MARVTEAGLLVFRSRIVYKNVLCFEIDCFTVIENSPYTFTT